MPIRNMYRYTTNPDKWVLAQAIADIAAVKTIATRVMLMVVLVREPSLIEL